MAIAMPKPWTLFLSTLVPALLIVVVTLYALTSRPERQEAAGVLPGKPLAAYNDLYPVLADGDGHLFLDRDRFVKAMKELSAVPSSKAISDLIYLGNANNVILLLHENEKQQYKQILSTYKALQDTSLQYDRIFNVYKDIVNGLGQSFVGTGIELVLHDTRNPLKSIVAIQNPISARRLGDSTTNFGLELIKNYSTSSSPGEGTSFVGYGLTLKDGRAVKSSTIPLFDETYGLIGFICLNIDVSKLNAMHPAAVDSFIGNLTLITNNDRIKELIENSRRKPKQ